MNPSVSVIVTIYNSERYLHRCLEGILAQSFKDFELLLIDDGSTDSSPEICDDYAQLDNRIRVFHTGNGGVASARQLGNDYALGEYSIHVDSDDWIEPDLLKEMFTTAKNNDADVVVIDYHLHELNDRISTQKVDGLDSREYLEGILTGHFWGALWNKMIRHSLYSRYNARFIPGINYCEDVLIEAQILKHILRISHVPLALYHYNKENESSICTKYTTESFRQREAFIHEVKQLLPEDRYSFPISMAQYFVHTEAIKHGYDDPMNKVVYYPLRATYKRNIPIPPIERISLSIKHIYYLVTNKLKNGISTQ